MYCATNQIPELNFLGPHNKPHGVRGLGKHCRMSFYTNIGHDTYATGSIPCNCTYCTSILNQLFIPGFPSQKQPCYQPVKYFTYWPVLGSFNNCNILQLSHKATSSEKIDKIHQVLIDNSSENMAALVQTDKYGAILELFFCFESKDKI